MIDFPITIERLRTEAARVVIRAESREEAERLAYEKAKSGGVVWEEEFVDLTVEVVE